MNRFFSAFADELRKIAEGEEVDTDKGVNIDKQETERQEPDMSQASDPPPSPAADLAGLDARHKLQDLLKTPDGRHDLRETYQGLRSKIDNLVGARKAFTRGLLRARRELYGPANSPREDLKRMLYRDEPFVDVRSV
jgi:hypothetical protein